jgi:hypothetical protein
MTRLEQRGAVAFRLVGILQSGRRRPALSALTAAQPKGVLTELRSEVRSPDSGRTGGNLRASRIASPHWGQSGAVCCSFRTSIGTAGIVTGEMHEWPASLGNGAQEALKGCPRFADGPADGLPRRPAPSRPASLREERAEVSVILGRSCR